MDPHGEREPERADGALPWSRMRWDVALTVASGTLIAAAGAGAAQAATAPADDSTAARPDRPGAHQATAVSERARAVARPVQQAGARAETLTVGRRTPRLRPAQLSTPPTVSTPPVRPRPTTHADVREAVDEVLPQREADDGRVHTVSQGETLWSIATDTLGEYATPSRVAALVQRLWAVNSTGIASGRPHLLAEGERIVLP